MRATPRRRTKTSASSNTCRDVVLVDSRPLRDRARRDYEKIRSELAKAQAQLDQYEKHDRPQFQRWISQNFGRLLTELRDLHAKILEAEELAMTVEAEVLFTGCSYQQAYRRASQRRSEPDEPEPPPQQKSSRKRRLTREEEAEAEAEAEEELFREFLGEEMFAKSEPAPAPARLKELYRALVRLLHPDKNKNLTAQQREWWHQAQEAYQAQDVGQLELILTLCELEQSDHDIRHTALSVLQRIVGRLKSSLREIRKRLRKHQQDPAWGFSTKRNHEVLHQQTQLQLEEELYRLREFYQQTEDLLRGWKKKPRPSRRTKPDWW